MADNLDIEQIRLVAKCKESIETLEQSLIFANQTFLEDHNHNMVTRISPYFNVIATQKLLVSRIEQAVSDDNWPEVISLVTHLNMAISLLRDDMRELLEEVQGLRIRPNKNDLH